MAGVMYLPLTLTASQTSSVEMNLDIRNLLNIRSHKQFEAGKRISQPNNCKNCNTALNILTLSTKLDFHQKNSSNNYKPPSDLNIYIQDSDKS